MQLKAVLLDLDGTLVDTAPRYGWLAKSRVISS